LTITTPTGNDGLTFYAKKVGGWTREVWEMANDLDRQGLDLDLDPEEEGMALVEREDEGFTDKPGGRSRFVPVQVLIDGPYGGIDLNLIERSEDVLLFAGGSGITFVIGCIEELIRKYSKEKRNVASRKKRIQVIWSVKKMSEQKIFPFDCQERSNPWTSHVQVRFKRSFQFL
jgi:ferric-chelate reductase